MRLIAHTIAKFTTRTIMTKCSASITCMIKMIEIKTAMSSCTEVTRNKFSLISELAWLTPLFIPDEDGGRTRRGTHAVIETIRFIAEDTTWLKKCLSLLPFRLLIPLVCHG